MEDVSQQCMLLGFCLSTDAMISPRIHRQYDDIANQTGFIYLCRI